MENPLFCVKLLQRDCDCVTERMTLLRETLLASSD